ncbi:MAG: hypothetical protein KA780_06645 [Prolixibacteraceae bacterium]|jgi:hypothetical protein|nr:hypothetical protein [Prolixibacteraceae bacterium]NLX28641.1 hypothetical protein [Bacteroidales bacterium]HNQ36662.1 hypothetical protein [Prolixibacteraceae bacterium]HOY50499.1 hypothetical protein [Prolixibacteraceae bacterium]HPJ77449.1 hypothetical protein [Prolixibacteraceae bacterium]
MKKRLETEEEYREALRRFLEIIENQLESDNEEELEELIRLMEIYEYENC